MRLRSFTTVAIRLMGLMSIFYGVLMVTYMLLTYVVFAEARMGGLGSVIFIQFLLPGLLIIFGIILIAVSPALGDSMSKGLED
jgi:integral membrane sensor domain MASE1